MISCTGTLNSGSERLRPHAFFGLWVCLVMCGGLGLGSGQPSSSVWGQVETAEEAEVAGQDEGDEQPDGGVCADKRRDKELLERNGGGG